MKVIIAVWNIAGKGKSKSIRQFAELLLRTYPDYLPIPPIDSIIRPSGDFTLGAEIGNNLIAVVSQGDPGTGLIGKLTIPIGKNCNIIICSTRTRGTDIDKLIQLAKKGNYDIVWTSTYEIQDASKHDKLNFLKGKHILDLLQSFAFGN